MKGMIRQFVWKQTSGELMHVVVYTDSGEVIAYNKEGRVLMHWTGLSPQAIGKVIQDFLEIVGQESSEPLPF